MKNFVFHFLDGKTVHLHFLHKIFFVANFYDISDKNLHLFRTNEKLLEMFARSEIHFRFLINCNQAN